EHLLGGPLPDQGADRGHAAVDRGAQRAGGQPPGAAVRLDRCDAGDGPAAVRDGELLPRLNAREDPGSLLVQLGTGHGGHGATIAMGTSSSTGGRGRWLGNPGRRPDHVALRTGTT